MILQRATLVLNKHWVPIDVTSVMRAMCKLVEGSAQAVCPLNYMVYDFDAWITRETEDETAVVRSATLAVQAPEVIILTRYTGVPRRVPAFSRLNVLKRDRCACQYCGVQLPLDELTVDHVIPRAQGGRSTWNNCVAACKACNHHKGDRTPRQAGMKLANTPARPEWVPPRRMTEIVQRNGWAMHAG